MKPFDPTDLTFDMTVNAKPGLDHAVEVLQAMFDMHHYIDIEIKVGKAQTDKQFRATHVWCGLVADCLNDAGIDKAALLSKKAIPCIWTKDGVKQDLYKPILLALSNKDSTKEQSRVEPSEVEKVLAKFISENFGLTLPAWPRKEQE